MVVIDEKVDSFLRQTRVAVLGTVSGNGTPLLTPMWFTWEDGGAYMITGRKSIKWRNIHLRPYVSLCVDHRDPPYASVIISGPIKEVDKPAYEIIRSMAPRYLGDKEGQEYANQYRDNPMSTVVFHLIPDRVARNLNS